MEKGTVLETRRSDLEDEETSMKPDVDGLKKLRAPFPREAVNLLPKPTRKENPKGKCLPESQGGHAPHWQDHYCGGYHGLPAIHLSYVGHAFVTERLLDVDPEWNWAPCTWSNGRPFFETDPAGRPYGLWIKLTVCGVTRLGYGSVEPGAHDAEKQLISDALRNAAMRFGIALDMWMKSGEDDVVQAGGGKDEVRVVPGGAPAPSERGPSIGLGGSTPREVAGVPIRVRETFEDIENEKVGGKGKHKDDTWGFLVVDEEGRDYIESYLVPRAQGIYQDMPEDLKARGDTVIAAYQRALIAYQEMKDRDEATPEVDL